MKNTWNTYKKKIFFILYLLPMISMTLGVSAFPDMTIKQKLILLGIMYVMVGFFIFLVYLAINKIINSLFHD
ncbi:hypothetical protein AAGG74_22270 [Bacillus mexicanus]|uniref:hypothetical protein n=1 Tax=Bacillus mexicanus TaxID=2834415 RepID=UPI00139E94B8|nr:hypothetical protein BTW01_10585 [Bacillus sp. SKDU12]